MKKPVKVVLIVLGVIIFWGVVISLSDDEEAKTENAATTAPAADNTATAAPAAANAEPVTNWGYSEDADKMSGTTTYQAFIDANEKLNFDFPYNGGSTATLVVRKKNNDTDIMFQISKGQIVTKNIVDGGTTRIKFDDEKPMTVDVKLPTDHSSDVIFLGSENKIVKKLKTAKKVILEVEFYQEGIHQIEFDTQGFKWEH